MNILNNTKEYKKCIIKYIKRRKAMNKILKMFLSLMVLLGVTAGFDIPVQALTSGDYEYELLEDGTAKITGYTGTETELVISSAVAGTVRVTSIGEGAFATNETLTDVELPISITSIEEGAFASCSNLKNVVFANNLIKIGDGAFTYCNALTSVTIPENVIAIGECAYQACSNLTTINIGNSVETIGENAFADCPKLADINVSEINLHYSSVDGVLFNKDKTELIQYPIANTRTSYVVPEGVETIADGTFSNSVLTNITLPSTIKSIDASTFENCDRLVSINVNNSNPDYSSVNGILFDKNKIHLIKCPVNNQIKVYTVPNTVKYIGASAFTDVKSLTEVTVGKAVIDIGSDAFYNCSALRVVKIMNVNCNIADGALPKTIKLYSCPNSTTSKYAEKYNIELVTNHQYDNGKVTKATLKNNGKITYTCTLCKAAKATPVYRIKTVKLKSSSYTYNGKVKTPKPVIKDSKGKTISSKYYTLSYSKGRKNVGKYSVKVTFKGRYSGTKTLNFNIVPKSTSISKVTAGSKKFTVRWKKKSAQTSGYQIQYSTSKSFKNSKTVTIKSNKTTSKTISKLKAKKKYYVKVRTYKTVKANGKNVKIYSSWSKAKTVTTKK